MDSVAKARLVLDQAFELVEIAPGEQAKRPYWALQLFTYHTPHIELVTQLSAAITTVALVGVCLRRDALVALLASPPMVFLGRISYVFYLIHFLLIEAVERSPAGDMSGRAGVLLVAGLALPLTVATSFAIHRTVELPMIRVGRRLGNRDARVMHSVS